MARGPGKYDELCTYVMDKSDASAVIVIVLGGNAGSGFSVQSIHPMVEDSMPSLLRAVADQIERDVAQRTSESPE
jgi:hypothetical protein